MKNPPPKPKPRFQWHDEQRACSINYHYLDEGVTVVKMCECDGWTHVFLVRHGKLSVYWVKRP